MSTTTHSGYRPTESKYKGGAHEMYVTYDLEQETRVVVLTKDTRD